MKPKSTKNADHYTWGSGCDGWILAPSPDMMVIEEQMPAGTEERRHHHERARQFFYVLDGTLTMEVAGEQHQLQPSNGIEISPGVKHQARNEGPQPVRFLVISSPTTRGDRIDELTRP